MKMPGLDGNLRMEVNTLFILVLVVLQELLPTEARCVMV